MSIPAKDEPTAFSIWLRTGQWPRAKVTQNLELKFNPWHDPRNGRFTFGPGGPRSKDPTEDLLKEDPSQQPIATIGQADAWRAQMLAEYGNMPRYRKAIEAKYRFYKSRVTPRQQSPVRQAIDFYTGEVEALKDIGKETVTAAYDLVTKPGPTLRKAGYGIAEFTNSVIMEGDTPTYHRLEQAEKWLKSASAKDIGYGVMKTAGNVALTIAPEVAAARVTAAVRGSRIGTTLAPKIPVKITWIDENVGLKGLAKEYNDSATGARSNVLTKLGQAPALERIMPDGSKRLVKFDGVEGDIIIDRKLSIFRTDKAKRQALSQSDALSQNNIIGRWEVPTQTQRRQAIRFLKKLGITNIVVRVVKPW